MIGASLRRGIKTLASRKIYIVMMVIVPLVSAFFFLNLMNEGLPLKVPSGMVDLDRSSMSRSVARNLRATELIEISGEYDNFNDALDKVRGGEIFGFFYIPRDFQKDALAGRTPTLSYYSN
ncbi:MAG: ABC transporter permease, partial [Duncaniella sp.]|nr:ABC transporter permease [Duncaniella sp.]